MTQLSMRVPDELHARINQAARDFGTSQQRFLLQLIEDGLTAWEKGVTVADEIKTAAKVYFTAEDMEVANAAGRLLFALCEIPWED